MKQFEANTIFCSLIRWLHLHRSTLLTSVISMHTCTGYKNSYASETCNNNDNDNDDNDDNVMMMMMMMVMTSNDNDNN